MASTPTPHPAALPPMPAVARIMSRFDRDQLAGFVEVAISLLDVSGGDVEAEPGTWTEATDPRDHDAGLTDDHEPAGDEQDAPWTEFTTRGRHKHTAGGTEPFDRHEDTEEDDDDSGVEDGPKGFDPEEDCCLAGDDRIAGGPAFAGYGGVLKAGGVDDDDEREQMLDDVPMLPVVSLEPNLFNGMRTSLGWSNLLSSFQAGGDGVLSADTGKVHRSRRALGRPHEPGVPV